MLPRIRRWNLKNKQGKACISNYLHVGFVNDFLSYEAFGPLGKLAFNVYLIHYPLLPLIYAQARLLFIKVFYTCLSLS